MPTVAIIPVKSFALGKQRLAGALSPGTRAELGRALADHVATVCASSGLMPLVVTADIEVAEWASRAGFPSLPDPGSGLDDAASAGVGWAASSGSSWVVLHSDLPLVDTSDVARLEEAVSAGRGVLAPSADGGTSAIGGGDSIRFSFGVSSFHQHLVALRDPVIIARPGLLLDIDSPGDLKAAMTTPRGRWLGEVITRSGAHRASRNLY